MAQCTLLVYWIIGTLLAYWIIHCLMDKSRSIDWFILQTILDSTHKRIYQYIIINDIKMVSNASSDMKMASNASKSGRSRRTMGVSPWIDPAKSIWAQIHLDPCRFGFLAGSGCLCVCFYRCCKGPHSSAIVSEGTHGARLPLWTNKKKRK